MKRALWGILVSAFVIVGLVSPLVYKTVGYSVYSVWFVLCLVGLLGAVGIWSQGWSSRDVGTTLQHLGKGILAFALSHITFAAILGIGILMGFIEGPLFRDIHILPIVDNYLFTGFTEELLFRGFALTALIKLLPTKKNGIPWAAILIGSVIFGLWHLPMSIIFGTRGMQLALRAILPTLSAVFFGVIYYKSRNLWFVSLIHGTTNYPIFPLITDNPLLGLVFMFIAVAVASLMGRGNLTDSRGLGWKSQSRI